MKLSDPRFARCAGLALALALSAFTAGAAGSREASLRFYEAAEGLTRAGFTPLALSNEPVRLIVQLSGDPVAVVEANAEEAAGLKLSKSEKQSHALQLKAAQNTFAPSVEALGGKVLSSFQYAYNGLKVEIPRHALEQLRNLAGVVSVHHVAIVHREHTRSVPLLGAPAAWGGVPGATGAGVKVAIIDTGIDYTHANFGGPGTVAAFQAADATDTVAADPALFGPNAPKVKGGIDLVGDDYNASSDDPDELTPRPDPNPLDCNGHGSHVAGSAAGFGVRADGTKYPGPYDAGTFSQPFRVGPGVAPRADLYAVRVFGCAGSTDVVVEAIEWAVANDMDVINMSLGLTFGVTDEEPGAEAANNAARKGVIVVGSAGNSGASPYIIGTPNSATRTIAVAANDSTEKFPGATMALSTGSSFVALNANAASLPAGPLTIKVLRNANGTVSLGCNEAEYAGTAGMLVVTVRGICARVARAVFGDKAGAAAVAMIDTSTNFPPFEGPITGNPDTGEQRNVTIPFLGVRGLLATAGTDGNRLVAADGGTVTLSSTTITNPGFRRFATFTSNGPRQVDSHLKPDVTAPGVSIFSTGVGSGNGGVFISGTSMASPHTAGAAALVRQVHPRWRVDEVKAAIMSTANPALVPNYATSRGGSGFLQPASAVATKVTAFGDDHTSSLSFGFEEIERDEEFDEEKEIELRNYGSSPVTFEVSAVLPQGSPHTIRLSKTHVTVKGRDEEDIDIRLIVPTETIGDSSSGGLSHREAAGLIRFTPVGGANGGIALHVPYLLVPRPLADVDAELERRRGVPTAVKVSNRKGAIASAADFYAWGLEDRDDDLRFNDLRAVGVQSFPDGTTADPNRRLLVFAVNMWQPWSHPSVNELDVLIDVDRDGTDDYALVGADSGLLTAGAFNGQFVSAVFNLRTGAGSLLFVAPAATNSSTALLLIRTSNLCAVNPPGTTNPSPCLSMTSNPRFNYRAFSFGLRLPEDDAIDGLPASFNAWTSSISQGMFVPLAPGERQTVPISIDAAEWAQTPAKGLMVVSPDNENGKDEARLLRVDVR